MSNFNFGSVDAVSKRKEQTKGKNLWTRFVGWLNNLLNAEHDWIDYENAPQSGQGALDNFIAGTTHSGLTQQQIQLNEMQMQNQEDIYQRQTQGMAKAGLNPALMYGSGAVSAPSSTSPTNLMNMSEVMQAVMVPAQLRMLKAQTQNVQADTEKKKVEAEKTGNEIDEVKARVKSLGISNEQQGIILSYLDRMQSAELAIKNASKDRIDADIKSIFQSIDNMSAEECATYISMCETVERINSLLSQQKLNDEEGRYYAKLVDNLEKQNKILGLQARDWDYINVVGNTSVSTGVGPFKGSESHPLTLHDLKNRAEKAGQEKVRQNKNNNKSWEEIKKDASDRYGALE